MVTCCFAGHRQTPHCLFKEIITAVEKLVLATDEIEFLSGSMGDFDKLCEKAVREIKKEYPKKNIHLCRVLPGCQYIPHKEEYQYQRSLFDDIIVCDASDGAHYKSMIGKRNRWMVEQSDFMIAYVMHESGGAYSTFQYAGKQNVEIIRIGMNT
ncbi:DUF1273 domain-containing protein [Thomasclavelia sp.]